MLTRVRPAGRRRVFRTETDIREQIKNSILAQRRTEAFRSAVAELRAKVPFQVLLTPPAPLRVSVAASGPKRGTANSSLTIVEFADFECPYCRALTTTLRQVSC
jgi:protein-disulfide isomerase